LIPASQATSLKDIRHFVKLNFPEFFGLKFKVLTEDSAQAELLRLEK